MKGLILLAMAAMLAMAPASSLMAQDKEKCTTECCKKCSDKCKEKCAAGKCKDKCCGKCSDTKCSDKKGCSKQQKES